MDTLRALSAFAHSVELGSLSAAARALDTGQPAVSKLVAQLERELGVRLLHRSATGLVLTEEGQRFHERVAGLLDGYEEAVAEVQSRVATPRGALRVAAPLALGERHLNRLMLEFIAPYPELTLELLLEDRFVDPVEERIDVALRIGGHAPPDLVCRPVAVWPRILVASPAYLAARGKPRTPEALVRHELLRYAGGSEELVLDGAHRQARLSVPGRYRVSSAAALLEAVRAGAGLALQPTWMVAELVERGELVRVLPGWTGPAQHASLLYAPRRHLPMRVHKLVDFLAQKLPQLPGALRR